MVSLEKKVTGDPVIRPFVKHHLSLGYQIKKDIDGRCDLLKRCKRCDQRYLYTFIKNGVEVEKCPWCDAK